MQAQTNILTGLKEYTEKDVENIFFRPILTGESAKELGIKVMYNTPVPMTMHYWSRSGNIIKGYQRGFQGGDAATKKEKIVPMTKTKAEMAFSPEDYFSTVYENITNRSDVDLQDLTGTELEAAETQLFRESLSESIRQAMWLGVMNDEGNDFLSQGILTQILTDIGANDTTTDIPIPSIYYPSNLRNEEFAQTLLATAWDNALPQLRQAKSEGQLVYFVTSTVYDNYEKSLNGVLLESSFTAMQNGRTELKYNGIPVIDMKIAGELSYTPIVLLTDRRNLAVAVNTRDFPGTEVRMWYNPDEIENRQRAVFMFGATYLLPEMLSLATYIGGTVSADQTGNLVTAYNVDNIEVQGAGTLEAFDANGVKIGKLSGSDLSTAFEVTGTASYLTFTAKSWGAGFEKFNIPVVQVASGS